MLFVSLRGERGGHSVPGSFVPGTEVQCRHQCRRRRWRFAHRDGEGRERGRGVNGGIGDDGRFDRGVGQAPVMFKKGGGGGW